MFISCICQHRGDRLGEVVLNVFVRVYGKIEAQASLLPFEVGQPVLKGFLEYCYAVLCWSLSPADKLVLSCWSAGLNTRNPSGTCARRGGDWFASRKVTFLQCQISLSCTCLENSWLLQPPLLKGRGRAAPPWFPSGAVTVVTSCLAIIGDRTSGT